MQGADGQRILVTGASGFIGSHLVEALVRQGVRTKALVHYNSGGRIGDLAALPPQILAEVELAFGDIQDPEQMTRLARGCDRIIHAAALIGIPYSYDAPRSYLRTNIEGSLNLLEAARRAGVVRFVFVSTSEVYGGALRTPMDETHPLQAQSPYAASKIGAEALVEAWRRNFDIPAVIIRPFNTFGPRQSRRAVIPTLIAQALAGGPLKLGDVSPIRDFSFVTDTVAGLIAAASAEALGPGPYNLGTGVGVSIGEVVERVGRRLGRRLVVERDPTRTRPPDGEVDRLVADNQAFRQATGWAPRVSLDEGLDRTIDAIRGDPAPDATTYVV
jgi:dTDP-glucose 4,6-dehydratase